MTEVADAAHRSALELAVADDSSADARRRLDEKQVVVFRPVGTLFSESHDVDVVVDQHGNVEGVSHIAGYIEVVPAEHDRRVGRSIRRVFDRTVKADADAA